MRNTIIFLSALTLAVSACKTAHRANSREPLTNSASVEATPPISTPFDGITDARTEYLQGYREGYRNGLLTLASPTWARVGIIYDATEPRNRGWEDGRLAARIAESIKLQKDE